MSPRALAPWIAVTVILSAGVSACASVYRSPGSDSLGPSEIAVIEHENPADSDFIIQDIDGKWRGIGLIERYELPPGEHSITVALNSYRYHSDSITLWFDAQAGRAYVVDAVVDEGNMQWRVAVLDKDLNVRVDYEKPSAR